MNKTSQKAPVSCLVKVHELKPSPWNPPKRITLAAIKSLASSMDRVGQQVPILVTESKQIVEGHRRWAAAKYLEWDYISACVVDDDAAEHIYAEVNNEVSKLQGNDALCVWMSNPSAVTSKKAKEFKKFAEIIGNKRMDKLAKSGMSIRVAKTAISISRFCDLEDVGSITDWLIRYAGTGTIGQIMKAIEAGEGRESIRRAFLADKAVKITIS